MARYIDADKIPYCAKTDPFLKRRIYTTPEMVASVPTADVEKIKHGHWIKRNNPNFSIFDNSTENIFICSECGREEGKNEPYCHCGAKMDEEVR